MTSVLMPDLYTSVPMNATIQSYKIVYLMGSNTLELFKVRVALGDLAVAHLDLAEAVRVPRLHPDRHVRNDLRLLGNLVARRVNQRPSVEID